MTFRRARFPGRFERQSAAQQRGWWLTALEQLAEAGDLVAEGGELHPDQAFTVAGLVVGMAETPFPLPFKSAKSASDGLQLIARGFQAAARAPLRQALGAAMAAAARCCRRLLDIDTEEAAAAQRRRYGED